MMIIISLRKLIKASVKILQQFGFKELKESENWKLQKSGKYYLTRNQSSVVAFTVGTQFSSNDTGFKLIGAHIDSPCLKLAPVSKLKQHEYHQACVEVYGGGLWHTWFDRDLTIGGKVVHLNKEKQIYQTSLFNAKRPILKIPNLAIHLKPTDQRDSFDLNKELHLRPIFSTEVYDQLLNPYLQKQESPDWKNHYSGLLGLISKDLNIEVEDIIDMDLRFADSQPAQIIGFHEDLISSPRIDNLMCSYLALKSLCDVENDSSFINCIFLFDHEEIGSRSNQGADSVFAPFILNRIFNVLSEGQIQAPDSYEKAIRRSFCISADMAHGIHPNYADKHHQNHQAKMNKGIVIKENCNQKYSTDAISASILRIIAKQANVPIQDFIVRNDSPCGSTIGPITSAITGLKSVDIGAAQFGMHSIRETSGVLDVLYMQNLFDEYFRSYQNLPTDFISS